MIRSEYKAVRSFVVVVGANSGIGKVLIQQLLKAGASVFGVDIQKESSIPISEQHHYFKANPLEDADLLRVAKKIKSKTLHIDALVNLSGTISQFKSIADMTLEEWSETYDISFKSCFNSCKVFAEALRIAPKAAIVNMSSGLAFGGQKKYGPYTTAKAAVISLSRTLATELAPNIRVNSIAPGAVDTNFIYKEDGTTRFDKEAYKSIVPLGTIAKPDEIASVILFLLSDGASHITGQCLHVNGGALMV